MAPNRCADVARTTRGRHADDARTARGRRADGARTVRGRCADGARTVPIRRAGDVDADSAGGQADGGEGWGAVEKRIECMVEMNTI